MVLADVMILRPFPIGPSRPFIMHDGDLGNLPQVLAVQLFDVSYHGSVLGDDVTDFFSPDADCMLTSGTC